MPSDPPINLVECVMAALIVGQSLVTISLLVTRLPTRRWYVPLLVFFVVNLITELEPLLTLAWADTQNFLPIMIFPALVLLGPSLYFYVDALTQPSRWRPRWPAIWHVLPFAYALVLSAILLFLPYTTKQQFFDDSMPGVDSGPLLVVLFMLLAFVAIYLIQTACYIYIIQRRLFRYRLTLRDLFASTENREIGWFIWILILLALSWVFSFLAILFDMFVDGSPMEAWLEGLVSLGLVWTLSVWGLRQKPGFEGSYAATDSDAKAGKYERSALTDEQSQRIGEKISAVMRDEALYADPNLSLAKLAEHIRVTPNYVSQTLNKTLESSFFDYVNHWRVQLAKSKLLSGDATVVDIANDAGFNSRSAFYKAFKKETGLTPTVFRREQGAARGS